MPWPVDIAQIVLLIRRRTVRFPRSQQTRLVVRHNRNKILRRIIVERRQRQQSSRRNPWRSTSKTLSRSIIKFRHHRRCILEPPLYPSRTHRSRQPTPVPQRHRTSAAATISSLLRRHRGSNLRVEQQRRRRHSLIIARQKALCQIFRNRIHSSTRQGMGLRITLVSSTNPS